MDFSAAFHSLSSDTLLFPGQETSSFLVSPENLPAFNFMKPFQEESKKRKIPENDENTKKSDDESSVSNEEASASVLLKKVRQTHNQLEMNRRKRLQAKFDELSILVGSTRKQKMTILTDASRAIDESRAEVEALEKELADLKTKEKIAQDSKLRNAFNSSAAKICILSPSGVFISANSPFRELLGISDENMLPSFIFTYIDSSDVCDVFKAMERLLKEDSFEECLEFKVVKRETELVRVRALLGVCSGVNSRRVLLTCVHCESDGDE